MMMWSGGGERASSASMAGMKSSATVQHRQPFASSTMFSSGQLSMPQDSEERPIYADIAEFVDDQSETAPRGVFQHVADEGRLAGA